MAVYFDIYLVCEEDGMGFGSKTAVAMVGNDGLNIVFGYYFAQSKMLCYNGLQYFWHLQKHIPRHIWAAVGDAVSGQLEG